MQAQTYIITQGQKDFAQPALSLNSPYDTVCGDLVYVAQYGKPTLVAIGAGEDELSYTNPTFSIETEEPDLIDEVVPYKLIVTLADYTQATADVYESQSTVTYISPCDKVGDTDIDYTTFETETDSFADDAYSGVPETYDVSDLFFVEADFCLETLAYTVTSVTGPDTTGAIITYNAGSYPYSLITLGGDDSTEITVSAGPAQYTTTNDIAVNMPPGTYTFTIEGTSTGGDSLSTTLTWTLIDPCAS